ncbi:hypothetical protein LDENG_00221640, partial [Lucifuga dentata]
HTRTHAHTHTHTADFCFNFLVKAVFFFSHADPCWIILPVWPLKSLQIDFKGPYCRFACLSLMCSIFIHVTLLTIISTAYYWNGELKMFFLPSRPPLVSVHSAIKINLLIL